MFVLKSTHDKVQLELKQTRITLKLTESAYRKTNDKYSDLVRHINRKGGQDWLDRAVLPESIKKSTVEQFTQEEIKRLLLLCHPDKHDGKQMAVELTQKLIKMRK
jgi:phage-related protein